MSTYNSTMNYIYILKHDINTHTRTHILYIYNQTLTFIGSRDISCDFPHFLGGCYPHFWVAPSSKRVTSSRSRARGAGAGTGAHGARRLPGRWTWRWEPGTQCPGCHGQRLQRSAKIGGLLWFIVVYLGSRFIEFSFRNLK